jgi:hypothetical protein
MNESDTDYLIHTYNETKSVGLVTPGKDSDDMVNQILCPPLQIRRQRSQSWSIQKTKNSIWFDPQQMRQESVDFVGPVV